jgi:long-chain acyl-CoA synthetase
VLLSADFLYDKVYPIKEDTKLRLVVTTSIGDELSSAKAFLGKKLGKIPVGKVKDPAAYDWKKILTDGSKKPKVEPTKVKNTDTAMLIYTGGTTGVAKGAELSHFNLISNCVGVSHWTPEPISETDVFMGALPFFHSFGMTVALMAATYFGSALVISPNPRDLGSLLSEVQTHKVTYYPGVPAMYISLLNFPDTPKYDLSSIKFCFSGAAPLPIEVQTQFEKLTGATMLEGYGMTELSPIATSNPPGKAKKGSIGMPIPNTVVRLVDLESGKLLDLSQTGPDHIGEIVVAGPQVMKGYYNKPEESKSSLKELSGLKFMHTGDIGYMDDQGYFFIVDRKKDMIIVSGYKVFPRDVEEAIYKHPAVKQVAVIGVPDERTTERVKAFIELKDGQTVSKEEMFKHCEENLAPYRRPKEIEFRSLGEFTTLVGKVLRRKLRESFF